MSYMKNFMMLLWAAVLPAMAGCRRMLEVQPKDKLAEAAVYGNRNGVYSVLNGVYSTMAGSVTYGQNLTMTLTDVLARYYSVYPKSKYKDLMEGNYSSAEVHDVTDPIWSAGYNLLLQNNILMGHVARDRNNGLSEEDRNILLGETHAIRAFLHFDLLRLFGPVYAIDSGKAAIPYNTAETQRINDILPASTVMQYILNDLDSAASWLQNDPVITQGITYQFSVVTGENFLRRRNLRFNYFAVKALQARVALYRGDKKTALECATEVIAKAGKIFPWSASDATLQRSVKQDLVFSTEVIFGLYNQELYQSYLTLFAATVDEILMPNEKGLLEFYDKNINDFRYRGWWRLDPNGIHKTKIFYRFSQPPSAATTPLQPQMYLQPLIRISEMYYIAAETTPDAAAAWAYLNTARLNRGLVALNTRADLNKEIENEYRKEFWGEGQLFFYYKRKNAGVVPTTAGADTTYMFTPALYSIPLPLSETLNR